MKCIIGITTNTNRQKADWPKLIDTTENWQILGPFKTRDKAIAIKDNIAKRNNCTKSLQEEEEESITSTPYWWIYKFDY